ncbi:hypothetical protein BFP72_14575 [Reichenbachiella sp. 5M10]|uniref:DegT/DnrJ/EryC1/StrS family aminotransferase n=1 Tax=Reichenbachiella sp. 5M10 TaxID=1889772 RepID=UPI000C3DBC8B|nr:DegT/DnrJ/EryC1/StrS family aminotransferase [Reichenbachiella sp. 5M10]PIB36536.1 hypothetical protein BFP72_14575 [Reichenbachiella sp. 5M10]
MKIPFFDTKRQYAGLQAEMQQSLEAIADEGMWIGGAAVGEFERAWAETVGARCVVAVGNGTDALFIGLCALGIGAGDEVIVPAVSWVSTASVVLQSGAVPVFVDVGADGLLDVELLLGKITARTKAILPVHLYGQMADMSAIRTLCKDRNIALLEDAAQAHLARRGGMGVGEGADLAAYSFYPTKNLGAWGDAGAIVCHDQDLADSCRAIANQGGRGVHDVLGVTSRMDTLQAAILLVKLQRLSQWTERRRAIAQRYVYHLKEVEGLQLPVVHEEAYHVYHHFVIRTSSRHVLRTYLQKHGIGTEVHYPEALPQLRVFNHLGQRVEEFAMADLFCQEAISLPVYPELRDEEVDYICRIIKTFYAKAEK